MHGERTPMPIPEFLPSHASPEIEHSLAQNGVVVLRKALSDDTMEYFHLYCTALFSILDLKLQELEANQVRPDDPLTTHVGIYRTTQIIGEDVATALLAQSYLAHSGFSRMSTPLGALMTLAFPASEKVFAPRKSVLRRQGSLGHAKKSAYVTWHRDSHAVRTADLGDCLNCWVPLQSVGIDRPSLDIVLGSNKVQRHRPVDYDILDHPSDEQVRIEYDSTKICTAVLDPGDVLVFDHHTLHRTQQMSSDTPSRVSGEFRFASRP